jgi:hypothetical protein
MPLSSVTIASLADLGYSVSMAAADRFSLSAAMRMGGSDATAMGRTPLRDDVVNVPLFEVDRRGARHRMTPW